MDNRSTVHIVPVYFETNIYILDKHNILIVKGPTTVQYHALGKKKASDTRKTEEDLPFLNIEHRCSNFAFGYMKNAPDSSIKNFKYDIFRQPLDFDAL